MTDVSAAETASDLGVWAELIGQTALVATLRRAVAGEPHAMSHAWLFTGPPGSGRSNAARAFAAALQCDSGGCGHCRACRTSLSGAHPDVTLVRTELLSIGVDEVRELVRRAVMSPTLSRWQVIVIEDADRVTERGADALLKSIEVPGIGGNRSCTSRSSCMVSARVWRRQPRSWRRRQPRRRRQPVSWTARNG